MVSSSSQYAISSPPAVTSVVYPEYEGPNYADSDSWGDILSPQYEYSPAISQFALLVRVHLVLVLR